MPIALGSQIRGFRRAAGLTQQQAAELAGMSVAALRDLEQGRIAKPRPSTLRRLADGLGLSMADTEVLLLYGNPEMLPDLRFWLQVLGPFTVYVDNQPIPLNSPRSRLLLATLALTPNQPVSVERLVEVSWGDRPPARAQARLRDDLARLRRRLRGLSASATEAARPPTSDPVSGAGASRLPEVVAEPGSYRLMLGENQADLLLFRKLSALGRQTLRQGAPDRACRLLSDAVALRKGNPLAGLVTRSGDPAVAAITQEWQSTVVAYAEIAIRHGQHPEALPLLRRVVEDDPLHEAASAQLIAALAATGDLPAAMVAFETFRTRLAEEFGTDPGPEVLRAHQALHARVRAAPASRFIARSQLPGDLPEFTGRAREIAWLHDTLALAAPYPGRPLPIIVLAGTTGIGKTRLAVHFAHQLLTAGRFAELQLYVDLQSATGEAVLPALLALLGVEPHQLPDHPTARGALYRHLLYHRSALLLLDNAAHVEQVRPLLPAGSENLVLVTGRHSLPLDGARVLDVGELPPMEARELLSRVAGADRLTADLDTTRQLAVACRGLPRALTLAGRALRSRTALSPTMLARRLQLSPDLAGSPDLARELTALEDDEPAARADAPQTG